MTYRIAVVGTGADPDNPNRDGYAMGYRHARSYRRLDDCEIVACADLVPENAEAFADHYDLPAENVFEDYRRMLDEVEPDVVSVTVPPAAHAEIVIGCAKSGVVDAIHCEKPMATTWRDCREMVHVCDEHDVQLTVNHQMRFGKPYRKAKALLDRGTIGRLQRLEITEDNLFDIGVHPLDLCSYFTDGESVEWVLGQIDYREENLWFGAHNANHALVQWRYENGVHGIASTGDGANFLDCYIRLTGTDGTIEIGADDGPALRFRTADSGWQTVDTDGENVYGHEPSLVWGAMERIAERLPDAVPYSVERRLRPETYNDRAIADVIRSLRTDRKSTLAASNAIDAAEIVFAGWESARRRGTVELPLEIEDNPLEAMVESGELQVEPASDVPDASP